MTLKQELKTLYPQVAEMRQELEQRGNDKDLQLTIQIKTLMLLDKIERNTRTP